MTVRDVARYLLRIAISTTPAFDAPVMGFPSEYRHHVWYGKTKMVRLSDGEKKLKICLFVLTEYTNVTDGQTDGQRHRMTAYRHSISSRGKNVLPRTSAARRGTASEPRPSALYMYTASQKTLDPYH